jgi:CRP-like cAMP-binding protein
VATSALFLELVEAESGAADLLGAAEVRRLQSGSSHRADWLGNASFLIVEEGFVVIRRALTEQRGVIICHAGPGSLLPAPEPDQTLDALVDARVTLVTESTYIELLAIPYVATVLSDALRSALRQKQASIANFGSVRHVERVQQKLLQLAEEHGRVVTGGIRLDFPITHELLAEMIGSARETVSRAIDQLERSGFLVRDGRAYRLQIKPEAVSAP